MTSQWISVRDQMPAYGESLRVLVYTDGVDFAGEQFFDIPADKLYGDDDELSEVAAAVTHWRFHDYPSKASCE